MKNEEIMTAEQLNISKRNKRRAWKLLGYRYDGHKGLCLHHVDESIRYNDIERYIQWNLEDLIVMTKGEHSSLHRKKDANYWKGKTFSEEHRRHLSESLKNNPREISEETRQKLSEATKDKCWYNNGTKNIRAFNCPEGFNKGRLKWSTNNG